MVKGHRTKSITSEMSPFAKHPGPFNEVRNPCTNQSTIRYRHDHAITTHNSYTLSDSGTVSGDVPCSACQGQRLREHIAQDDLAFPTVNSDAGIAVIECNQLGDAIELLLHEQAVLDTTVAIIRGSNETYTAPRTEKHREAHRNTRRHTSTQTMSGCCGCWGQ